MNLKPNNYRSTKSSWSTTFGRNIVDSGIHHWTFKLIKYGGYIRLGLFKNKRDPRKYKDKYLAYDPDTDYIFNWQCGYLQDPTKANACLRDYGIKATEGSTCDVYVDFNKLQISFGVNGKMYETAFDNIEQCKYRVAVYRHTEGDMIEIIDYKTY